MRAICFFILLAASTQISSSVFAAGLEKELKGSDAQILYMAMQAASPALAQEGERLVSGTIRCGSIDEYCCSFFALSEEKEEAVSDEIRMGFPSPIIEFEAPDAVPQVCGPQALELVNLISSLTSNKYDTLQITRASCEPSQCAILVE